MYNQKYHKFQSFYNHKFGFHINGPRNDAFDEVLRLKPKVVKTLDFSVEVMKRIKREIPDVFLIGRLYVETQDFGQLSGKSPQAARRKGIEMAERILRQEVNYDKHHFNGQPIFNAWESLNEVFPEWMDEDTQKLYDEYQVAFGQKMRAAGLEPVAFNFGQGNGRGRQWLKLYPGTLEFYKYLGFHEYDWPTMDRLHRLGLNGPSEPQNLVPGVGEGRGNDGMWRCLRYRRIMNEGIRQQYGDRHTVIITECGMTQAVWGGSAGDLGPWARQLTVPANIPGGVAPTPIPVDDYWNSLLWYNSELMKDDYVMGACLFVTGASGRPEWDTFEHLGQITNRIFAFQKESLIDRSTEPKPPAEEAFTPPVQPPVNIREPETIPSPQPPEPEWSYTIETGRGLGLLVGDIGVANQQITITKPDRSRQQVTSGHKPEFGRGGFETYAQAPGNYTVEFLGQKFGFALDGGFTKIIFKKADKPIQPPSSPSIPQPQPAPPPTELATPPEAPAPPVNIRKPEPVSSPQPAPKPAEPGWSYTMETGRGLGLLVGDIGTARVPITVTKPDGRRERVTSGHKPEFGVGGFEVYAQAPGQYTVEFLEQRFILTLSGQFARVTFKQTAAAAEQFSAASAPETDNDDADAGLFQRFFRFLAGFFN